MSFNLLDPGGSGGSTDNGDRDRDEEPDVEDETTSSSSSSQTVTPTSGSGNVEPSEPEEDDDTSNDSSSRRTVTPTAGSGNVESSEPEGEGAETPERQSDLGDDEQRLTRGRTDGQFEAEDPTPSIDDRGDRVNIDEVAETSDQRSAIDQQRRDFAGEFDRFDAEDVVLRETDGELVFDVETAAIERELEVERTQIQQQFVDRGFEGEEFAVRFDADAGEFDVVVDEFAVAQRLQGEVRDLAELETGLEQRFIEVERTDSGFAASIDEEAVAEQRERQADAFDVPDFDAPPIEEERIELTAEQEFFDGITGGRVDPLVQSIEGRRRDLADRGQEAIDTAGGVLTTPGGVAIAGLGAVERARTAELDIEDIEHSVPAFGSAAVRTAAEIDDIDVQDIEDSTPRFGGATVEAARRTADIDVAEIEERIPRFGVAGIRTAAEIDNIDVEDIDASVPAFGSVGIETARQAADIQVGTIEDSVPAFGSAAVRTAAEIDDRELVERVSEVDIDSGDIDEIFSAPSIVDDVRSGARPGVERVGRGLSDRGGVGEAAVAAGTLGVAAPEPVSTTAGAAVLLGGAGLLAADRALNRRVSEIQAPADRSEFDQGEIEAPATGATVGTAEIEAPSEPSEFDTVEIDAPETIELQESELDVEEMRIDDPRGEVIQTSQLVEPALIEERSESEFEGDTQREIVVPGEFLPDEEVTIGGTGEFGELEEPTPNFVENGRADAISEFDRGVEELDSAIARRSVEIQEVEEPLFEGQQPQQQRDIETIEREIAQSVEVPATTQTPTTSRTQAPGVGLDQQPLTGIDQDVDLPPIDQQGQRERSQEQPAFDLPPIEATAQAPGFAQPPAFESAPAAGFGQTTSRSSQRRSERFDLPDFDEGSDPFGDGFDEAFETEAVEFDTVDIADVEAQFDDF